MGGRTEPMTSPFDSRITFCHTRDLGATARFYEELLGLPMVLDQGGCRVFRDANGYLLEIQRFDDPKWGGPG
ncbi:MAG: VOC family protein [Candidatus Eisenbacteria bacterium]